MGEGWDGYHAILHRNFYLRHELGLEFVTT